LKRLIGIPFVVASLFSLSVTAFVQASDALAYLNGGEAKAFSHSLFYSHDRLEYDFEPRGEIDFTADRAGAEVGYAITEQMHVSLNGGVILDPKLNSTTAEWRGRSGYFWGMQISDMIFPPTDFRPGLYLQANALSDVSYFDRQVVNGAAATISQKLREWQYGGAVLGVWKWGRWSPYIGPQLRGSKTKWIDMSPAPGNPDEISGDLDKNLGLSFGCSVALTPSLKIQAQAQVLNGEMIAIGLNWGMPARL
jgi:hypothetical protein